MISEGRRRLIKIHLQCFNGPYIRLGKLKWICVPGLSFHSFNRGDRAFGSVLLKSHKPNENFSIEYMISFQFTDEDLWTCNWVKTRMNNCMFKNCPITFGRYVWCNGADGICIRGSVILLYRYNIRIYSNWNRW